ncbi:MAG: tail fiber domain-containing protein [Erysipelotrichaceae bacterium]
MAEIIVGQTITTQQYANADTTPQISNAYLFYVDVKLNSQDIVNNKSNITITHRMKAIRANYSNYSQTYSTVQIGSDVKATKYQSNASKNVTYTLASWTGDVEHNENGELSLTVNGVWHGYDDGNSYSAVSNTLSSLIEMPAILRISKLSVEPATLTGGNATISITKYIADYTTTVKYKVDSIEYILAEKSSGTTFYLAYDTIKNLIGAFTTAVVEITAVTFNGNNPVGSETKSIIVQTGRMPISLYDDRQGNVGVTFGEEATEPDVHFKLLTYFYENAVFDTEKGVYIKDSNNTAKEVLKLNNDDLVIGEDVRASNKNTYVKGYDVKLENKFYTLSFEQDRFVTKSTNVNLGTIANPWRRAYCTQAMYVTSDERNKKYINNLDDKYEQLFHKLNPKRFKMKKDASDDNKWHIGFIAQEVEQAIEESNLSNQYMIEHAFFEKNGEQTDEYTLSYSEFIALNTYMLKKAFLRIEELESKIEELEELISAG